MVQYGTVNAALYPRYSCTYDGTYVWVAGSDGNSSDAILDARVKEARRLSRLGLRLGEDLHRRSCSYGVVGVDWHLVLHGVEILVEIVIWDKFVFNGLTFLVDNRVGVHSHWRLGSCQH